MAALLIWLPEMGLFIVDVLQLQSCLDRCGSKDTMLLSMVLFLLPCTAVIIAGYIKLLMWNKDVLGAC